MGVFVECKSVVTGLFFMTFMLIVLAGCAGEGHSGDDGAPDSSGGADGGIGFDVDTAAFDKYAVKMMEESHIPGMAAAVVKGTKLCWAKGYGLADMENSVPATPDTLWMIASVSKTSIVTALMQENEKGLIGLDDDVNNHLPFAVINPGSPGTPITVRMLLTHTSSIKDNWTVLRAGYVPGDSTVPLGDFMKDYLTTGGKNYDAAKNYYANTPGTVHKYSNVGAALAAYIVEHVAGTSFDAYTDGHVYNPLKMEETGWHLSGLNLSHIAVPYLYSKDSGSYTALAQYGYPDYPDGALRTSAVQLARFLMSYINKGELDGVKILDASTVAEILRVQDPVNDPGQALIWNYDYTNGEERFGHSGNDEGATATMYARTSDGVGVILLSNADMGQDAAAALNFYEIRDRLFKDSTKLCAP
jgi:CubicO group peptidase (beta-lactamase class C family)